MGRAPAGREGEKPALPKTWVSTAGGDCECSGDCRLHGECEGPHSLKRRRFAPLRAVSLISTRFLKRTLRSRKQAAAPPLCRPRGRDDPTPWGGSRSTCLCPRTGFRTRIRMVERWGAAGWRLGATGPGLSEQERRLFPRRCRQRATCRPAERVSFRRARFSRGRFSRGRFSRGSRSDRRGTRRRTRPRSPPADPRRWSPGSTAPPVVSAAACAPPSSLRAPETPVA